MAAPDAALRRLVNGACQRPADAELGAAGCRALLRAAIYNTTDRILTPTHACVLLCNQLLASCPMIAPTFVAALTAVLDEAAAAAGPQRDAAIAAAADAAARAIIMSLSRPDQQATAWSLLLPLLRYMQRRAASSAPAVCCVLQWLRAQPLFPGNWGSARLNLAIGRGLLGLVLSSPHAEPPVFGSLLLGVWAHLDDAVAASVPATTQVGWVISELCASVSRCVAAAATTSGVLLSSAEAHRPLVRSLDLLCLVCGHWEGVTARGVSRAVVAARAAHVCAGDSPLARRIAHHVTALQRAADTLTPITRTAMAAPVATRGCGSPSCAGCRDPAVAALFGHPRLTAELASFWAPSCRFAAPLMAVQLQPQPSWRSRGGLFAYSGSANSGVDSSGGGHVLGVPRHCCGSAGACWSPPAHMAASATAQRGGARTRAASAAVSHLSLSDDVLRHVFSFLTPTPTPTPTLEGRVSDRRGHGVSGGDGPVLSLPVVVRLASVCGAWRGALVEGFPRLWAAEFQRRFGAVVECGGDRLIKSRRVANGGSRAVVHSSGSSVRGRGRSGEAVESSVSERGASTTHVGAVCDCRALTLTYVVPGEDPPTVGEDGLPSSSSSSFASLSSALAAAEAAAAPSAAATAASAAAAAAAAAPTPRHPHDWHRMLWRRLLAEAALERYVRGLQLQARQLCSSTASAAAGSGSRPAQTKRALRQIHDAPHVKSMRLLIGGRGVSSSSSSSTGRRGAREPEALAYIEGLLTRAAATTAATAQQQRVLPSAALPSPASSSAAAETAPAAKSSSGGATVLLSPKGRGGGGGGQVWLCPMCDCVAPQFKSEVGLVAHFAAGHAGAVGLYRRG